MFKPHECGDTRLKCIDCDGPVCPKCFVQCPVGQRCKACSSKFSSHVLNVGFGQLALMFLVALALGGAFGFLGAYLSGGLWMWIITYFLGVAAGNLIHKVVGFKIGPKVIAVATVGVLTGSSVGMMFSPMNMAAEMASNSAVQPYMQAQDYMQNAWAQWSEKDKTNSETRLLAVKDEAQKRLAELVTAVKNKDTCMVLAAAGDEKTASRYDILMVRDATDDALLCAQGGGTSLRTIAKGDVLDWGYVARKAGFKAAAPQAPAVALARYETEKESARSVMGMMQAFSVVDLLIFLAGVITILSGRAPALQFPFMRR